MPKATSAFRKPDGAWLLLGFALLLTVVVYAPGLSGGFVYDDSTFIVGNDAVHVTTLELRRWAAAAFAFPGGAHQGRWLGMLTFAANHYVGGLDPYGYKLTNLAIHLANGVLLFMVLCALFDWHRLVAGESRFGQSGSKMAAAAIAGLWLILPINLTGVLYVAQRLEALSTTFVLLGLWFYLKARIARWRCAGSPLRLWASLIVCTGVGALVKESAILLPLYAACAEWVIGRARNAGGKTDRAIVALYAVLLALPAIIGIAWLASWVFGSGTYARSFDTGQRLLTEARVLVDYIGWTLAPSLDALTLYHDDINASRGILDPPSTLASIAALAVLAAVAIVQRRRRPLLSIGILWFFAAHLLTATVIPLLLAFEHRNYFASAGLLLALVSLLPWEGSSRRSVMPQWLIVAAAASFYALTTWMRAEEWSDPLRLAVAEAAKRPLSPLAQYDEAVTLLKAGSSAGPDAFQNGLRVLDEKRRLPGAGIAFEQALIEIVTRASKPVDPDWYAAILAKLRAAPPSLQDARSLQFLNECFAAGRCVADGDFLSQAYAAAMAFPHPSPLLLYVHSQYAAFIEKDLARAESDLRTASAMSPLDGNLHEALATVLLRAGKRAEAEAQVERMKRIDQLGMLDDSIRRVEDQIAESGHGPGGTSSVPGGST